MTGNSQSHQQASKASLQGRFGCFPTYQATFHVSQWGIFIGYSLKLRLVTTENSIMKKNWASDACFSFLNGGKQSGGTHMILTGSCLKVSLMVRLCLAFVLLQWKLQNKEGRTTQ